MTDTTNPANEQEIIPSGAALEIKPEIATKPSFLSDVRNGLVHVAKTVWQVPAARGYLATLIVRLGVPAGLGAILIPLIDALVK